MNDTAVKVENLTVKFGEFKAVDDVSFTVSKGEIFGFLGANGAGKTTTIRILCGILAPTSGKVEVAGIPLERGEGRGDAIKGKVGYMSQKFTLYNDMSVEENLDFAAGIRKLGLRVYQRRREELLGFIDFDRPLGTMVSSLPAGLKQQVSLAAALLHEPEIVFLDEPTAGVSSASRARFWELIKDLSKRGTTIFVTSHYMDEVEQCDRIALMRAGRLIALDNPQGLERSTFPEPIYQLTPKAPLALAEIETLKASDLLESFEPHGLRFHASARSRPAWNEFLAKEGARFEIREVRPTLEDVFIKLVEGKNR